MLGTSVTSEDDAYENSTATGDDLVNGIQDDGVLTPLVPLVSGETSYTLPVIYTNATGSNAYIYAWIDFNRNGIFELDESNIQAVVPSSSSNPRTTNLIFNYPKGTVLNSGDTTFVRIRITTDTLPVSNPSPTSEDTRSVGLATNGEVEDYIIDIVILNINGVVWYDLNYNGLIDPLEPFVENATVELYNSNNPSLPVGITSTDSSGNYSFSNLVSGSYFVKVTLPNGYTYTIPYLGTNNLINSQVSPKTGSSLNLQLSPSNTNAQVNAGLVILESISGKAFYDCNKNGVLDYGEPFLCGATFMIYDINGNAVKSETTNCEGYYNINNLTPGTYSIQVIPPPGMGYTLQNDSSYYGSKPTNTDGIFTVTLANVDYQSGFAGFVGDAFLDLKYCENCNMGTNSCLINCPY